MFRIGMAVAVGYLVVAATSAACSAEFRAGAAKADITPGQGVSLDGPISKNGPVRGIHDRLYARALVLDDASTRLAIVICDSCIIGSDVYDAAKAMRICAMAGIDVTRKAIWRDRKQILGGLGEGELKQWLQQPR